MKSNIFLRFITVCAVFFAVNICLAAVLSTGEALAFAETKGKELILVFQEPDLQKRYDVLDEMIKKYVDMDYIAKFVLGKYWRQMTTEQKERYRRIFERYGLAFYKTLPLEYAKNMVYEIKGAQAEGNFVSVVANVKIYIGDELQTITLTFRIHRPKNEIKIVDVKVAESSLLLSYRGKFYEMIAQSDEELDWFLDDFDDLTASLEYNLNQNIVNQQNSLEFNGEKR